VLCLLGLKGDRRNGKLFKIRTVQKSYNRSGIVGILGGLGIRKINNLRAINGGVEYDPDQVHQISLRK
jgi:hypothetical protein